MTVIKTLSVKKVFPSVTVTIPDITITKRVTFIKGANGSGKSTFLKALLQWITVQGTIESSATFAYMPEHPSFPLDISLQLFLDVLHPNNVDIHTLLKQFHLEHKTTSLLHSLSKGMKGKVNVIQALALDRDVYLLDEPFNGLDIEGVDQLLAIIKQSTKRFIITSHIPLKDCPADWDVITFD